MVLAKRKSAARSKAIISDDDDDEPVSPAASGATPRATEMPAVAATADAELAAPS